MLAFFLSALENEQDRTQFTFLYERYRSEMEQTALNMLGQQSDAEDAVQNAFIQVIRHFEKIYEIPCEEIRFWLISIVKNESRMLIRKRRKIVPLEDWDGTTQVAKDATTYTELLALVKNLPETYRSVLEMKLLLGYSDKEIANHLGISETAVSSRASRGRSLLRKIMEKEGILP